MGGGPAGVPSLNNHLYGLVKSLTPSRYTAALSAATGNPHMPVFGHVDIAVIPVVFYNGIRICRRIVFVAAQAICTV